MRRIRDKAVQEGDLLYFVNRELLPYLRELERRETNWTQYTPTWNGSALAGLSGAYKRQGDGVWVQMYLVIPSGYSIPTDRWAFSLPDGLTRETGAAPHFHPGACLCRDDSDGSNNVVGAVQSSGVALHLEAKGGAVDWNTPFAWEAGDSLSIWAYAPVQQYA